MDQGQGVFTVGWKLLQNWAGARVEDGGFDDVLRLIEVVCCPVFNDLAMCLKFDHAVGEDGFTFSCSTRFDERIHLCGLEDTRESVEWDRIADGRKFDNRAGHYFTFFSIVVIAGHVDAIGTEIDEEENSSIRYRLHGGILGALFSGRPMLSRGTFANTRARVVVVAWVDPQCDSRNRLGSDGAEREASRQPGH
jgi:hypothetical protein